MSLRQWEEIQKLLREGELRKREQPKYHFMSHLHFFRILLWAAAILMVPCRSTAQATEPAAQASVQQPTDSLEISLLTCSPHHEVYSLYGHTAIRVRDKASGSDLAVNYGLFDFAQPHFVLRFVFGLTDYSMGTVPFHYFEMEYRERGSSVTEQVLNLTHDEKVRILQALEANSRHPIYRYNYFHDNCTTRARDMLLSHLDGEVRFTSPVDSSATFRSMVHDWNEDSPWARFGNDILLGVGADKKTTREERQFLPFNLMADFSTATIVGDSVRPLVLRTETVVPGIPQVAEPGFPLRPTTCALILLAITLMVSAIEWKTRRIIWVYDVVLMVACGLAGLILTAMVFSQHPTVSLNLQILLFNPLPLFLAIPVARAARRHRRHWWWTVSAILIILFFAGNFFQHYAEGMIILALSLLERVLQAFSWRGTKIRIFSL